MKQRTALFVEKELHDKFKGLSALKGKTITIQLTELMEKFVKKEQEK